MEPDARTLHNPFTTLNIRLARHMIESHLLYLYSQPSEFTSWSSSLLFVVLHAIRKKYALGENDLRICILDTRRLRDTTIYPATALMKVYDIQNVDKLKFQYYSHEYLLHGRLQNTGCYDLADFDDLEQAGLYQLYPELYHRTKDLIKKVLAMRELFTERPITWDQSSIRVTKRLGQCFRAQFELPVALGFVGLRRCMENETVILQRHWNILRDLTLPISYLGAVHQAADAEVVEDDLPEVTRLCLFLRAFTDLSFPNGLWCD